MALEVAEGLTRERRISEPNVADRHLPHLVERPGPGGVRPARTGTSKRLRALCLALMSLAIVAAIGMIAVRRQDALIEEERKSAAVTTSLSKPSSFALGRLEPLGRVVEVAASEGGGNARIQSIEVEEGQRVEAGSVLAVLDHEARLKAELESCQRRLDQAKARLRQAERIAESGHDESVSAVRIAEITIERAQNDLRKISRLYRSQAASQEEHDNARRDVEVAERTLEANRARLIRFSAVEGQDPVDVQVAREEVAVSEANVAEARERLRQAYVLAPMRGTVLTVRLRSGEYVGNRPILDMGATDRMTARAEAYESIVRRLNAGQAVILRSPALDAPLKGTLDTVSSVVRRQSIVDALPAANTDARVVEVVVRLDPESSRIAGRFVGLQVRAEFLP